MLADLALKIVEFLVIRYEGDIWAELKKVFAKRNETLALNQANKDLQDAIKTKDPAKIDAAAVADINGPST